MAPPLPTLLLAPTRSLPPALASTPTPTPTSAPVPAVLNAVLPLLLVGCISLALIVVLHAVLYCTNRAIRADAGADAARTRRDALRAAVSTPRPITSPSLMVDVPSSRLAVNAPGSQSAADADNARRIFNASTLPRGDPLASVNSRPPGPGADSQRPDTPSRSADTPSRPERSALDAPARLRPLLLPARLAGRPIPDLPIYPAATLPPATYPGTRPPTRLGFLPPFRPSIRPPARPGPIPTVQPTGPLHPAVRARAALPARPDGARSSRVMQLLAMDFACKGGNGASGSGYARIPDGNDGETEEHAVVSTAQHAVVAGARRTVVGTGAGTRSPTGAATDPTDTTTVPTTTGSTTTSGVPSPSARTTARIRRVLFRDTLSIVGIEDIEAAVEQPSTAGSSNTDGAAGDWPRSPLTPVSQLSPTSPRSPTTPTLRPTSSETIARIVAVYSASEDGCAPLVLSPSDDDGSISSTRTRKGPTTTAPPSVVNANARGTATADNQLLFPRPPASKAPTAFAPVDARLFTPSPRPSTASSDDASSITTSAGQTSRVSDAGSDVPMLRGGGGTGRRQRRRSSSPRTAIAEQFMRALVLDGQSGRGSIIRTISHSSFPLSDEAGS